MSKPDTQWSEEEKKVYKEFEKKNKELSEEQEKYRKVKDLFMILFYYDKYDFLLFSDRHKLSVNTTSFQSLEIEMRKLQASIKDATEGFDETLTKLLEWKVKSEMVIYQVSQHTCAHSTHTGPQLIGTHRPTKS